MVSEGPTDEKKKEGNESSPTTPSSSSSSSSIPLTTGVNAPKSNENKRKRFNEACSECRRAHKACSGERPCERCAKLGITDKCKSLERKKRIIASKRWYNYKINQQDDGKLIFENKFTRQENKPYEHYEKTLLRLSGIPIDRNNNMSILPPGTSPSMPTNINLSHFPATSSKTDVGIPNSYRPAQQYPQHLPLYQTVVQPPKATPAPPPQMHLPPQEQTYHHYYHHSQHHYYVDHSAPASSSSNSTATSSIHSTNTAKNYSPYENNNLPLIGLQPSSYSNSGGLRTAHYVQQDDYHDHHSMHNTVATIDSKQQAVFSPTPKSAVVASAPSSSASAKSIGSRLPSIEEMMGTTHSSQYHFTGPHDTRTGNPLNEQAPRKTSTPPSTQNSPAASTHTKNVSGADCITNMKQKR